MDMRVSLSLFADQCNNKQFVETGKHRINGAWYSQSMPSLCCLRHSRRLSMSTLEVSNLNDGTTTVATTFVTNGSAKVLD